MRVRIREIKVGVTMVKLVILFVPAILILVVTGCEPPEPDSAVNVHLKDYSYVLPVPEENYSAESTVCVLARCKEIEKFAEKRKGNWIDYWYFSRWEVIQVTQGQWQEDELRFIFKDSWPTPESGIMVKKAPCEYIEERVFFFWINVLEKPPVIFGQQWRSPIYPYNSPPEIAQQEYKKILAPVGNFLKQQNVGGGMTRIVEARANGFIVEYDDLTDSEMFRMIFIEKNTHKIDRME